MEQEEMGSGELVLERRKTYRMPVRVPVFADGFGVDSSTVTVNLTPGGMYVETRESPPLQASFDFSLCLPGEEGPLELTGRVVRNGRESKEPAGVGIEFMAVNRRDHDRLNQFVDRMGAAFGR
jgi:hypothetical protein